jgi:hypothetical protein
MENNTDYKTMKVTGGEYLTVQEMSCILGESTNTINKRLFRLGIKPLAKDALYPISALDAIRDVTMGRPKNKNIQVKTGKSKSEKTAVVKSPEKKKQGSAKK